MSMLELLPKLCMADLIALMRPIASYPVFVVSHVAMPQSRLFIPRVHCPRMRENSTFLFSLPAGTLQQTGGAGPRQQCHDRERHQAIGGLTDVRDVEVSKVGDQVGASQRS